MAAAMLSSDHVLPQPPARPPTKRLASARRLIPTRLPKPKLPSRLLVPSFPGSGRAQFMSPTDPEEAKAQTLGMLAVRVYAARNLEAKDKNGKSDPFFRLRAGELRVDSEVVKTCLNPTWGELPDGVYSHTKDGYSRKAVQIELPVFASHVDKQRIEIVFWDKDRLTKNDYLGEVSLGYQDWFNAAIKQNLAVDDFPISFADPRNKPKWYPLVSSRSRKAVSGDVLVKVGFVPSSGSSLFPSATSSPDPARLPAERERELAELFTVVHGGRQRASTTDRILTAPPTEGVGTIDADDTPGGKVAAGVGMGDPDDSDASDDDMSASEDDRSDMGSTSDDDDEYGPFDEAQYHYTASPSPEPSDPLAAAGKALAEGGLIPSMADGHLAPPTSEPQQMVTTPGGRHRISVPGFIRAGSSKSIAGLRSLAHSHSASSRDQTGSASGTTTPGGESSTSMNSKAPGRLNLRDRIRNKSSTSILREGSGSSEMIQPGPSKRKKRIRKKRRGPQVGPSEGERGSHFALHNESDIVGICFIEIVSAHDLPRWRNMTRTTFDMDPFLIASFSQKVFRTRVVRHSLDPVWNERLFFHVKRHEANFGICFSAFDWDKVSSNDFIGEVTLSMTDLIDRAPKADPKTGLYAHKDAQIIGDQLHEYRLALVPSKTEELEAKKPCEITVRAKYTPYAAVRQSFWRRYLQQYDTDDTGSFAEIEVFSMLDSLGSTLSKETRDSFFTRNGKTTHDSLTMDELIGCLETELCKPRSKKRLIDSNFIDGTESGTVTPAAVDVGAAAKPLADLSLGDNAGEAGLGYTGSSRLLKGISGREPAITTSSSGPTHQHAAKETTSAVPKARQGSSDSHLEDQVVERVINIKTCPLCHRPRLTKRSEMDIVTHLALCASQDWGTIGSLITGNFVTTNQAHRKWLTKIISKVSNGSYELGANSANIIVQNRMTGQLQEEKMQVYVRLGIRLLYKGVGSNRMEGARIRRMLHSMSVKQGVKFDSPASAADIKPFIDFHRLNVGEILDPLPSFKNFNEFFYRKLKPDARPIADPHDPGTVVSSADCRMMAFATIDDATRIWIKGREFSIARLLGDKYKDEAKNYVGGALCIFRLAPQDYHRFHSAVDGTVADVHHITGQYYTVNPMAIRSAIDVYGENIRTIVPIDSPTFGRVMNVCVGAMMVGSINVTVKPGDEIKRGDEYGYYAFGGSTNITIFPTGAIAFDDDLLENSERAIETLVRVGMRIGHKI